MDRVISGVGFVFLAASLGSAQPSGGPYGPIDQTYEIPKAAHVYVAPDGKSDATGLRWRSPPRWRPPSRASSPAMPLCCAAASIVPAAWC
ncbi:MAG: hypothetical protein IPP47_19230 [Bryobacterales bacterium]|nr:hypothetical protein [Bryobacterales bacterium]